MYTTLKYPLDNISLVGLNFLMNMVQSKGILNLEEIEDLKYIIWKI